MFSIHDEGFVIFKSGLFMLVNLKVNCYSLLYHSKYNMLQKSQFLQYIFLKRTFLEIWVISYLITYTAPP